MTVTNLRRIASCDQDLYQEPRGQQRCTLSNDVYLRLLV